MTSNVRYDVNKHEWYVMTSKTSSWRQKVRRDINVMMLKLLDKSKIPNTILVRLCFKTIWAPIWHSYYVSYFDLFPCYFSTMQISYQVYHNNGCDTALHTDRHTHTNTSIIITSLCIFYTIRFTFTTWCNDSNLVDNYMVHNVSNCLHWNQQSLQLDFTFCWSEFCA